MIWQGRTEGRISTFLKPNAWSFLALESLATAILTYTRKTPVKINEGLSWLGCMSNLAVG
jgi:hypothetical protein